MIQRNCIVLFLLLLCMLNLSAQAQEKRITASFSDISLSEAMWRIEQSIGYTFFYDATQVRVEQKVSLECKDEKLSVALDKMLRPIRLSFDIINTQIAIFNQDDFLPPLGIRVRGKVLDEEGAAIIGANVMVEGTTKGTVTDIEGYFALEAPPDASIVVSFIGYKQQKIKVKGGSLLSVKMEVDAIALQEIVVVGYGTQKKINLTGAVSQVEGQVLENRPIQNVSIGIQGWMPGVTIVSGEGRPGQDGGVIRVRGIGTLNDANPYILVDGLETGTLNSIDPNDVESVSVLKDAASAAIYGSKASNGVILITTKRGKTGKPRIIYNGYVSLQNPTMLQDLMSSYDYARFYDKALVEYGRPPHFDTVGDGKVYEKFKDGSDPYNYPNTDWYDLAYRTGIQHSHNMNVSGGTDYLKYLMSIGYLKQEGTLPNAARQQFNGRTNLDVKLNSRLNVHVNMAYINNDYTDPNSSYGEDGSEQIVMRLGKMAPWIVARYEDGTWGTISDGSPIAWLDVDQTVRRENQNFSGILSADYTLFNGLVATLTGAYVNNQQHYKAFRKFIQYNPNKKSDPNRLNENYYGWHRATFDVLLNYDKRFGRHGLKTLAGWHTEKYTYNESKAERSNFPNNDLTDMNAGDAATVKNSGYSRELAMISWFGHVNYDYAGKYLFEANIRADASSRFAKGHRWGYFPSFSAAWRISEEAFMEEAVGWLTDLKIRGSYGNLGNQSALSDFYPWMNSYDLDAHYSLTGRLQTGYHQKNYKIATISWEKARTWGVGIDATLFGKLTVGLDYYDRKTTGIIMDVPVPAEFGLGAYKDNVGAMVNRGVELTLNYNESWDDWSFGVSANLAYNKNKVLYLDGVQSLADGDLKVKQVGAAYGTYRLYKTGGFFQSDEEAKRWQEKHKNDAGYPFKRDFKAGDLIYMDTNEDGLINADDRVLCGSSNPSYTFGLNLSAGYKSIDCSVMLTGVADVKRMIDINGFGGEWSGDDCHPNNIWLDAWTPDNRDAKMPRIAVGKTSNNLEYSDFWLQDGSYLRLKNLQLGYTLPKKILKSMGVENLRVYYSGENLLTFHKMMVEADPELGNLYGFPINRSHAFGVNITF